ncbi:uncharacterized protein LOC128132900 [Lactuca sativa]|uniref:uncharacterized protein LOC128132900 n=1 Tax=Lactuca sativa TaxID=4236 RepID=UPI0022B03B46|nr:uncharacterized protein LOC128132900 [Lactuca sativa]
MPQRPTCGNPEPTPLEINSATFQAAVSAAVTAALAQIHNGNNSGRNGQGAGSSNNGMNQGPTKTCSFKDFTNAKPRTFNGTGGMITLKRWIEMAESVFEICECPEEVKVKFVACTFVDQALTWWHGHVETFTFPIANAMSWAELHEMLMAEYCPCGEIQKMEQELWNLTIRNSDIGAYISRLSELSLLCPGDALYQLQSKGSHVKVLQDLSSPEPEARSNKNNNNRNYNNNNTNNSGNNVGASHTCYGCGKTGHFRRNCPNVNIPGNGRAGRVLTMVQREAVQDPVVVTGNMMIILLFV